MRIFSIEIDKMIEIVGWKLLFPWLVSYLKSKKKITPTHCVQIFQKYNLSMTLPPSYLKSKNKLGVITSVFGRFIFFFFIEGKKFYQHNWLKIFQYQQRWRCHIRVLNSATSYSCWWWWCWYVFWEHF